MIKTTKDRLRDYYCDIEASVSNLKKMPTQENLSELKNSLNRFFNESNCLGVIFTNNFDKLFFGLYVMPKIPADDIVKIISTDIRYIIKDYYVEIDSRLFKEDINLTDSEITALLVHDIAHLVNNSVPCEVVKADIDEYLRKNHEVIKLSDSVHYKEILSFGFRDALRKSTTIFEKKTYVPDDITDEFIDWCTYSHYIENAFSKINKLGLNYNREVDNKFIVLSWVLRLYKDVLHNRIPALKTLERCQELTPSQIERKELNNMARRLSRIDDDMLLESTDYNSILSSIRETFVNNKTIYGSYNILEAVKNDIVGLMIEKDECKENEPDAMPDLLHRINNKMSLIQDYVDSDKSMGKEEYKQWNNMYKELSIMRNQLSNEKIYVPKRGMYNKYGLQDDV